MPESPFQAEFVELIVREVIRRLRESGVTVLPSTGSTASVAVPTATATANEISVTDRVVTLETLRDRLQGVKRVTIGSKAIVTPAVRDELKRKKIELIRK